MVLKVTPSSTFNTLLRNFRQAAEAETVELEKMSSGKRVLKSQDDSASLAIGTKLDALVRSQKQATRNANDGISFVQTAEGGLGEISNLLTRLRELSIQSASDTVGENERGMIDEEFTGLKSEIDRISEVTSFNGTNIINGGDKGILNFQIGAFSNESNQIEFDTDNNHADTNDLGISGIGAQTKEDAKESLNYIDEAITKISGQRAHLGSIQSRLHHAVNNLEVSILNHAETKNKMIDLDVAESATKLVLAKSIKDIAGKSLAISHRIPQSALKLIE